MGIEYLSSPDAVSTTSITGLFVSRYHRPKNRIHEWQHCSEMDAVPVSYFHPEDGAVIAGTGGLRKLRFADRTRGKGKRGGPRVIYYWRDAADQFWLFTLYDKDESADLTASERKALGAMLLREMEARRRK